jgi:hypothetical protein
MPVHVAAKLGGYCIVVAGLIGKKTNMGTGVISSDFAALLWELFSSERGPWKGHN